MKIINYSREYLDLDADSASNETPADDLQQLEEPRLAEWDLDLAGRRPLDDQIYGLARPLHRPHVEQRNPPPVVEDSHSPNRLSVDHVVVSIPSEDLRSQSATSQVDFPSALPIPVGAARGSAAQAYPPPLAVAQPNYGQHRISNASTPLTARPQNFLSSSALNASSPLPATQAQPKASSQTRQAKKQQSYAETRTAPVLAANSKSKSDGVSSAAFTAKQATRVRGDPVVPLANDASLPQGHRNSKSSSKYSTPNTLVSSARSSEMELTPMSSRKASKEFRSDNSQQELSPKPLNDQKELVFSDTPKQRLWVRIIRIVNFIRAILTSAYTIYNIATIWNRPLYVDLGAKPYFFASLIFATVDLVFAFVKAFPRIFWICWDVSSWNPFTRTFSVWNLVADHEMILDCSPILANVILKVYGLRLSEVVAQLSAGVDQNVAIINMDQLKVTKALLAVFTCMLILTLTLHTLRLCKTLIFRNRATILAGLVIAKVAMLMFDLFTNSIVLYHVLGFNGTELFHWALIPGLLVAVFAASPAIGLTTNFVLNFPLHVTHIRMSLSVSKMKYPPMSQIIRKAFRKTFHPFIVIIFGSYAIFSTGALLYILRTLYDVTQEEIVRVPATMFAIDDTRTIILSLLWFNIVINYLSGIFSALFFSVVMVLVILRPDVIIKALLCCYCGKNRR